MKYTLKADEDMDQFILASLTNHIYPDLRVGLNPLLYNCAKHRLRRVIVHSELTDLLHGALIGCKTNHLMKQASRGSLGCQHIAPVMQQPAANRSSVSLQEAPAACCPGWIFHICIYQAAPLV